MKRLLEYFQSGLNQPARTVGAEVETSFRCGEEPASLAQSQETLHVLLRKGWTTVQQKGALITEIADKDGNRLLYELGRQNIEVATRPATRASVAGIAQDTLCQLYEAAQSAGLTPHFAPILETAEDLLVIPDERDARWLALDGRAALAPLATISAVQYTVEISLGQAIPCLNLLGRAIDSFLADYPQDSVWKEYIRASLAGYDSLRYGGPLQFDSLRNYCGQLSRHKVVQNGRLVSYAEAGEFDIRLFLRSVWWYFRRKRYGTRLCIEVRPLPRREDAKLEGQLRKVLDTMNL